MKTAAMQDFSYDPFDPAVMADPLPYYRVLREHYPVYYLDKWDTFALSRFADIWDVLAVNDGVVLKIGDRIEVLRDDGLPVRVIYLRRRPAGTQQAVPAESRRATGDPDPRTCQRASRRAVTPPDVRPHPGIRRHRRRIRGM